MQDDLDFNFHLQNFKFVILNNFKNVKNYQSFIF